MLPVVTCNRQMQTPPDETAGGCQSIRNFQSACGVPASVNRLEDLARLRMVARELEEPQIDL